MNHDRECVLIVDDSEANVDILLNLLSDYQVLVALDGPTALDLLNNTKPDVILLDIMMPEMDGYKVCRIIRENACWKDIPILFITALTDEASIVNGFEVGGNDYVTKPFRHAELLARVQSQIRYKRAVERLHYLAVTDELTGISNRRAFFAEGCKLFDQATSEQRTLSALMIDLDYFKKVNDSYGHAAGDLVLKSFVQQTRKWLSHSDLFGRIGGEEFAIIPPHRSVNQAIELAESIRQDIAQQEIQIKDNQIRFTVSIGVAYTNQQINNLDALLSSADRQLYAAKQTQRNCVHYPRSAEMIER